MFIFIVYIPFSSYLYRYSYCIEVRIKLGLSDIYDMVKVRRSEKTGHFEMCLKRVCVKVTDSESTVLRHMCVIVIDMWERE